MVLGFLTIWVDPDTKYKNYDHEKESEKRRLKKREEEQKKREEEQKKKKEKKRLEEEAEIKAFSRDPKLFSKLVDSIAPGIYGYNRIKEALILQLMSGVRKTQEGGVGTRGDIHILLVGDPGCGKSQLLKRVNVVAPKGRYVSGKGVSGAGLTATVVKDEFLRGWAAWVAV